MAVVECDLKMNISSVSLLLQINVDYFKENILCTVTIFCCHCFMDFTKTFISVRVSIKSIRGQTFGVLNKSVALLLKYFISCSRWMDEYSHESGTFPKV